MRWPVSPSALGRALVAALVLLPIAALAQSSPGLYTGQVPTAAQWNSYFAAKVDTTNGVVNGLTDTGTLGVTGAATLLKTTGRDLTISDGGTYVNIIAANNNPTYWRSNWELADTSTPQGNTEFNLLGYSGNTIPLSSAQTWRGFNAQATLSGSSSSDQHFYQFASQDDFTTTASPNGAYTLTVSNTIGTGGAGAHTALLSAITTNGTGITTSVNPVALEANASATVNVGGTSGSQLGDQYGAYIQATLGSGATYWTKNVGGEVDLSANSGSSVQETDGWDIVLLGGHASHGLGTRDSGIVFGSANPSTGWDYGIRFGGVEASSPFQTTATLLWVGRTMTVGNVLDASNATITGDFIKSSNFAVDGTGNITIATPAIGTAASYACFTSGGKLISSASPC